MCLEGYLSPRRRVFVVLWCLGNEEGTVSAVNTDGAGASSCVVPHHFRIGLWNAKHRTAINGN